MKTPLRSDSIVLQWLVKWSAGSLNTYHVGADGRTAWERIRGRKCNQAICEFGEIVLYKELSEKKLKGDLKPRYKDGVWLGLREGTEECYIGTEEGVVRAWAARRLSNDLRWSKIVVDKIQGTVEQPNPNVPGSGVPIKIHIPVDSHISPAAPEVRQSDVVPRGVYFKKEDFEKYGYDKNCVGCRTLEADLEQHDKIPHTIECRRRMEAAMAEDEDDKIRVERTEARKERYVMEKGEENVQKMKKKDEEERSGDGVKRKAESDEVPSVHVDPGRGGG